MGDPKNTYGVDMRKEVKVKDSKSVITPTDMGWAGESKKEESKSGGNKKSKP